jgi:hypothetical protein
MNAISEAHEEGDVVESSVEIKKPTRKQLEDQYLGAVARLMADAHERKSVDVLVDVLVWILAKAIMGHRSTWCAGDIMRRLGDYICRLEDHALAESEAARAKEDGRAFH